MAAGHPSTASSSPSSSDTTRLLSNMLFKSAILILAASLQSVLAVVGPGPATGNISRSSSRPLPFVPSAGGESPNADIFGYQQPYTTRRLARTRRELTSSLEQVKVRLGASSLCQGRFTFANHLHLLATTFIPSSPGLPIRTSSVFVSSAFTDSKPASLTSTSSSSCRTDRTKWTLAGSVFPNGAPSDTDAYTLKQNGDLWCVEDASFLHHALPGLY